MDCVITWRLAEGPWGLFLGSLRGTKDPRYERALKSHMCLVKLGVPLKMARLQFWCSLRLIETQAICKLQMEKYHVATA